MFIYIIFYHISYITISFITYIIIIYGIYEATYIQNYVYPQPNILLLAGTQKIFLIQWLEVT